MSVLGAPLDRAPVYCDRKCRSNPNGICTKRTQSRITDTVRCPFFIRESKEDVDDE